MGKVSTDGSVHISSRYIGWPSIRPEIYISRHSRAPLPEIYSLISEASYPADAGETDASDVEVAPSTW